MYIYLYDVYIIYLLFQLIHTFIHILLFITTNQRQFRKNWDFIVANFVSYQEYS